MSIDIEIPRYTLIREIGSGGMAVVYLATQEGLDRPVALKLLRQNLSGSGEEFKKRFMHEGRMLAQLEHENIVKIYDIGSTDSAVFMAMEYLKGGTLSQRMQSGPVTVSDVIKICAKVAMALHTAHSKNIIHRDLKPSNIMFRDPLTPVLTDFGIARKIDLDLALTETGMMVGTPQYMSPEQVQGRSVDARSDIYSLGLMFYRLLTGELPFRATEPIALAMQQIQDPPPPLPQEYSELQPVMDQMLAKNPSDRYQSTVDFCNHLQSISLTNETYATQLSTATRIYGSAEFSAKRIRLSSESEKPQSQEVPSVSKSISSIIQTIKREKKTRNWVLASLVVILAAVVFYSIYDSSGITADEERRITYELRKFNAYVANMSILGPPGENATESLQKMLAISSQYNQVREAADELGNLYEAEAFEYYVDTRLDEANNLIFKGLEFAPENEALLKLKETVSVAVEERERLVRIDQLLTQAEQGAKQDNLLPPALGNAYQAFKDVLELDGQNEQARVGLSKIQMRVVKQAKDTWAAGNSADAKAAIDNAEQLFGSSTQISDLKEEISQAERLGVEQQKLIDYLDLAETQVASGKLVEPPMDNALESYQSVLAIRPDHQAAIRGLQNIANHYQEEAQQHFQKDEFELSLEATAKGLKALPQHEGLLLAQSAATNRLDSRSREIQTRLQQAGRLADSGQFIPGLAGMEAGSENAYDAFRGVAEFDPGNLQAQTGLKQLPDRVFQAAASYERDGDLDKARDLVTAAQVIYPQERRFGNKATAIEALVAERAARQNLTKKLQLADQLINQRPVNVGLIEQIAQLLRELTVEFPNEVSVSDRLTNFITVIDNEADRISRGGKEEDAIAMVNHALLLYPANQRLKKAGDAIQQRKLDREEEESKRIAAQSGVLTIDATPWGRVLEIRNKDQVLQELPAETETPVVVTLLEGEYSILLAAGDSDGTVKLSAQVRRQNVVKARSDLNLMTSQDYFEKSDW